jgi:hypothetical protein
MEECSICCLQHVQTSEQCLYHNIALQLCNKDGQSTQKLSNLQWLAQLFQQHLPPPKIWCASCKGDHTKGECPFDFVAGELGLNHENPIHPAVKYWYNTYHDYFPFHFMVCNVVTHSTQKCPHNDMKFVSRGPLYMHFHKRVIKGYVSPSYQFPWDIVTNSWSSTSDDSSESSMDVNEDEDQGANIPPDPPEAPNPPCLIIIIITRRECLAETH